MEEKQTVTDDREKTAAPNASREPLFGGLLFGCMVLLAVVAMGVMGWGIYRGWHLNQERAVLPSIVTLPGEENLPSEEAPPQDVTPVTPTPEEMTAENLKKAQAVEIKVLNGGAAKGSAVTVAAMLKKAGYTNVAAGNTVGNYTGAAIYFAANVEQEAAVVKDTLLTTYPKIETKPAVKENKETTQAPLTVILGK